MRAINLKTEHMRNPLGIDVREPYLTWNCLDGKGKVHMRFRFWKMTMWYVTAERLFVMRCIMCIQVVSKVARDIHGSFVFGMNSIRLASGAKKLFLKQESWKRTNGKQNGLIQS